MITRLLNNAEIRAITHNSIDIDFLADGGFIPVRFTDSQLNVYNEKQEDVRTLFSSSVIFDFFSDTDCISFDMRFLSRSTRNFASVDLYVDGVMQKCIKHEPVPERTTVEFCALGNCLKRITIFLPNLVGMEYCNLSVESGAVISAVKKEKKMLVLGDSITQGYDAKTGSLCYVNRLVSRYDKVEVLNQGIGAYYFDYRTIDENLPFNPDLIICAYGTNDWRNILDFSEYRNNAEKFITRLFSVYPNAAVIGVLPFWRKGNEEIAKNSGYGYKEIYACLKELYGRGRKSYILEGLSVIPHEERFFTDGRLHPNEEGFELYASALFEIIDKNQLL